MDIKIVASMFEDLKKLTTDKFNNLQKYIEEKSVDTDNGLDIHEEDKSFIQDELKGILIQNKKLAEFVSSNSNKQNEELNSIKSQMSQSTDAIKKLLEAPKQTVNHVHRINIESLKIFFTILILGVLLFTSLVANVYQVMVKSKLADSDIKYRYIKMKGVIDGKALYRLESIFNYNPDDEKQSLIRDSVETFEENVRQMREDTERKKLIR